MQSNIKWIDDKGFEHGFKESSGSPCFSIKSSTDLEGIGNKTIGTAEAVIAFTGETTEIRIRADLDNTGTIYIGKKGILSDGTNDFVRLESGDEIILEYDDATNPLYAISDTAAQKINIGALL